MKREDMDSIGELYSYTSDVTHYSAGIYRSKPGGSLYVIESEQPVRVTTGPAHDGAPRPIAEYLASNADWFEKANEVLRTQGLTELTKSS